MIRSSFIAALILFALSGLAQADCYKKVVEFAEGLCAEFVDTSGGTSSQSYSGQLDARLPGLLRKLVDIGGEARVEISEGDYENVLRNDVPRALEDGRKCRLQVADKFYDRICAASSVSRPATTSEQPVASAVPTTTFTKRAAINEEMGWAQVKTHPQKHFGNVLANVKRGEIFYTYVQLTGWWKVQTEAGVEGYMDRSHFSLID